MVKAWIVGTAIIVSIILVLLLPLFATDRAANARWGRSSRVQLMLTVWCIVLFLLYAGITPFEIYDTIPAEVWDDYKLSHAVTQLSFGALFLWFPLAVLHVVAMVTRWLKKSVLPTRLLLVSTVLYGCAVIAGMLASDAGASLIPMN